MAQKLEEMMYCTIVCVWGLWGGFRQDGSAGNCLQNLFAGPWLNGVYQAGATAIVVQRYCCSISHSPFNNGIFPLHFSTVFARASLSPIHPPDCPQMQKNPFSLILSGFFGNINNWMHNISRARVTDLLFHLRTPQHACVLLVLPFPSGGFVQCKEHELGALVNVPREKINFSWMSHVCFKRQGGGGKPINKRNPDVPQNNGGSYEIILFIIRKEEGWRENRLVNHLSSFYKLATFSWTDLKPSSRFIPPSDLLPLIFSPLLVSFGIAQPFLPVSLP